MGMTSNKNIEIIKNICKNNNISEDFNYIDNQHYIDFICNVHGVFSEKPIQIKKGNLCKKCKLEKEFNIKHNNKFSYKFNDNKVRSKDKVIILCPLHGTYEQGIGAHKSGQGCPDCYKLSKLGTKYSHQQMDNMVKPYIISNYPRILSDKTDFYCKDHKNYFSTSIKQIKNGFGCNLCASINMNIDTSEFIRKANSIHNHTYTYEDSIYTKSKEKLIITCKKHGNFLQSAGHHLNGAGCQICANIRRDTLLKTKYFNKPTWLYYIKVNDFYKIGITTQLNILDRYRTDIKKGVDIKIIDSILFDTGEEAHAIEQNIIEENRQYILDENILVAGNTEIFSKNIINNLKNYTRGKNISEEHKEAVTKEQIQKYRNEKINYTEGKIV